MTSAGGSPRGHRGAHRAPSTPGRRVAVLTVLAVLVAAVAGLVLLLARPWSGTGGAADPGPAALAGVAPDVARWLAGEVRPEVPVTADGDVRAALAGTPAAGRVTASADSGLRIVEGRPPGGALVLARFEASDGTALSVVDPAPGVPTAAELDRRRSLAAAVLANPVAGATGRAADVLRRGDIDARLLGLLAGLVARMDVHVADLPPASGEPADGPPARRLIVDRAGGERLTPGAPATDRLVQYLAAQRPPYAPHTVEQTDRGVLIGFRYVSDPDAVVSGRTS